MSFLPTINVIVGDNGTGKSQLLKLLYSCTNVLHHGNDVKTNLQRNIADKLIGVFQPDALGRLATRQQGRARADITVRYRNVKNRLKFSFATNSKTEVRVDSFPSNRLESTPVFLPSRELMSIYPGFVSLHNTR
ncbi:AAA family ATPase [Bifidobacterium apri]|uniref:AAA family ATPase n=1 Tax=Bifidobacterium apri TaxID=1769423 RepID=UPI0012662AED|nr:AAA family ATPase [Bifidobacterium apri]